MTAVLLHGVTRLGAQPPEECQPHGLLEAGSLQALITVAGPARTDAQSALAGALAHTQLLTAWAAKSDVVPVRYGAAFSNEAAVRTHVLSGAARLHRLLNEVSGCQEYTLSIAPNGNTNGTAVSPTKQHLSSARSGDDGARHETVREHPDGDPSGQCFGVSQASVGRRFLADRAAARRSRQRIADERSDFVRALVSCTLTDAIAHRAISPVQDSVCTDLALLLSRATVTKTVSRLASAAPRAEALGLTIKLSGPWPPFSFCGDDDPMREPHPAGQRASAPCTLTTPNPLTRVARPGADHA